MSKKGGVRTTDYKTQSYRQTSGKLVVSKGNFGGDREMKQYMFDACPNCRVDECPAADICDYETTKENGTKCEFMKKYIGSIVDTIMRNMVVESEFQLYRIGMHLVPLYKNLCRLQIEEMGVRRVVQLTPKGSWQIHPIYNEIRQHISMIEKTWRSIGIHDIMIKELIDAGQISPESGDIPMTGGTVGNSFERDVGQTDV
jgi:hypothetical protein